MRFLSRFCAAFLALLAFFAVTAPEHGGADTARDISVEETTGSELPQVR